MIISENPEPNRSEFNTLLDKTLFELRHRAKISPKEIAKLDGNKFEPEVARILEEKAIGTPFANSIKLISNQKFPDITANKFYGIEVKTTTGNHWKTTGNSVLESTRVDGVERIFILFGKLGDPIEFKCRLYEECLSKIVVTHSPRYAIDMDLVEGATIFDKMKLPYDELRKRENPIKPIVEYYKSKLKKGEQIWWMDQDDSSKGSSPILKLWKNVELREREKLIAKGMVFFPELFSKRSDKFERFVFWLVASQSIVCSNIRDLFTAGGKTTIIIGTNQFGNAPRIFLTLIQNLPDIISIISETKSSELTENWNYKTTEKKKIRDWMELIGKEADKILDAAHLNIREMIKEKLKEIGI